MLPLFKTLRTVGMAAAMRPKWVGRAVLVTSALLLISAVAAACGTTGAVKRGGSNSPEAALANRLVTLASMQAGEVGRSTASVRLTQDIARVVLLKHLPVTPSQRHKLVATLLNPAIPPGEPLALVAVARVKGCEAAADLGLSGAFSRSAMVATPCLQTTFNLFQRDVRSEQGARLALWSREGLHAAVGATSRSNAERFLDAAATLLLDQPVSPQRLLLSGRLARLYLSIKAPLRAERLAEQALFQWEGAGLSADEVDALLGDLAPALAQSDHLAVLATQVHKANSTDKGPTVAADVSLEVALRMAQRQLPKATVNASEMAAKVTGGASWRRAHIAGLLGDRAGMTRHLRAGLRDLQTQQRTAELATILGADGAVTEALGAVAGPGGSAGSSPALLQAQQRVALGALKGALKLQEWPAAQGWFGYLRGASRFQGHLVFATALAKADQFDRAHRHLTTALKSASAVRAARVAEAAKNIDDFELTLAAVRIARSSPTSWLNALLSLAQLLETSGLPKRTSPSVEVAWIAAVL